MKAMCLQAMAIVYGNCFEEIGPFNDTAYIMTKMEEVRTVLLTLSPVNFFKHFRFCLKYVGQKKYLATIYFINKKLFYVSN